MRLIKDSISKSKWQNVTIKEFCEFEGIKEIDFYQALDDMKKSY